MAEISVESMCRRVCCSCSRSDPGNTSVLRSHRRSGGRAGSRVVPSVPATRPPKRSGSKVLGRCRRSRRPVRRSGQEARSSGGVPQVRATRPPKWSERKVRWRAAGPGSPSAEAVGAQGPLAYGRRASFAASSGRRSARSFARVSSVLAVRDRQPKPAALPSVSLGRAHRNAEALPRTAPMTRCTIHPSAVGGRADPCRAIDPTSVQSHPRDTGAASHDRGPARCLGERPKSLTVISDPPRGLASAARAPEHMELVTESPSRSRRPSARAVADVHQGLGGVATSGPGDPVAA